MWGRYGPKGPRPRRPLSFSIDHAGWTVRSVGIALRSGGIGTRGTVVQPGTNKRAGATPVAHKKVRQVVERS